MFRVIVITILHLFIIVVVGLAGLLKFKIFERIDQIQPVYKDYYEKVADGPLYKQIPLELQIQMNQVDSGLFMLHKVSWESSFAFAILLGIVMLLVFVNLVIEIKRKLIQLRN